MKNQDRERGQPNRQEEEEENKWAGHGAATRHKYHRPVQIWGQACPGLVTIFFFLKAVQGLPVGRKPRRHAVKETRRGSPATFRVPCPQRLPPFPPRQQIRHTRPAQRTAARGAALYTGDATLAAAGGVALCGCGAGGAFACGNWRMATRRVVAHRTAGGRHVEWPAAAVRCSPLSLPHRDHAARALHWLRSWDHHL